jgi:hypothetical protein
MRPLEAQALWLPRSENPASEVAAGPVQDEGTTDLAIERGRIGCAALEK